MRLSFRVVGLLMLPLLCAPLCVHGQSVTSLDAAVQEGVKYLTGRFPRGTRAALISVRSESPELSEFALNKIGGTLVNGGWFTVVERSGAALETLEREMSYQLSGDVSDETSLSIGKQLGAEIIISGALEKPDQNWRLDIQAVRVESAERAGQWSAGNIRPDPSWASLASPRGAAIAFDGDTMSARDKKTVATGLRSVLQTGKIGLDLDENSEAQTGYRFAFAVYREQINVAGRAMLKAEITVEFSRNGRVLCAAGPYNITETNESMIARRVAERLKEDTAFFNLVNKAIQ